MLTFIVPANEASLPLTVNLSPAANFILFLLLSSASFAQWSRELVVFPSEGSSRAVQVHTHTPTVYVCAHAVTEPSPLTPDLSVLHTECKCLELKSSRCAAPTLVSLLTSTASVRLRRSL